MQTATTTHPPAATEQRAPLFAVGERVRIIGFRDVFTVRNRRRYGGDAVATWDYHVYSSFGTPVSWVFERFLEAT